MDDVGEIWHALAHWKAVSSTCQRHISKGLTKGHNLTVSQPKPAVSVFELSGCLFLGRRCCSIGGLFRSFCLSVCRVVHCDQTGQDSVLDSSCKYSVYRSRIGMWGRDFDWYYFRPQSTLTPKLGFELGWRGQNLTLELWPNGSRWSNTLKW